MNDSTPLDAPLPWFESWLNEAADAGIVNHNAMSLATIDPDGMPSVRTVLLKGYDERGFTFYTNLGSRKGRALKANPRAALCFYWRPLDRQVRIQGATEQVPDPEADEYWSTRHRGSQLGAWASRQSESLADRATLEARVEEMRVRFLGQPVPRPSHWSGIRVIPRHIEFWVGRESRLHDRWAFDQVNGSWVRTRLFP